MPVRLPFLLLIAAAAGLGLPRMSLGAQHPLALTPPMGWNDWAHYQCDFTANTILANARALVRTGLAARGYDTVTIDDCWMLKRRDSHGNLQPDPARFPRGMRQVAAAIHALGLRFGIYEDAGSATCGGFAGSGGSGALGTPHFLDDARLFAAWGVDYLKLDGCNIHPDRGGAGNAAYREAYRAESRALERVGRPIVFSESAPAYFQGTPQWYDVLAWVRHYGELWREGSDIATYDRQRPGRARFGSVLWNYDYNLQLGRFQKPGNWNDADFIIAGDEGMTLAESRSQLALWSMMSAPLILSSDLEHLAPAALGILGNRAVLSVDQDPLGVMATLVRRSASMDVLMKPLEGGDYALAVLNRSPAPLRIRLAAGELGFTATCRLETHELWSGARQRSVDALGCEIGAHDTDVWQIRPAAGCGAPARIGAITRTVPDVPASRRDAEDYTRCLAAPGILEPCAGTPEELWRIMPDGSLRSGRQCLTGLGRHAALANCRAAASQRWRYTLLGNLINRASRLCLSGGASGSLTLRACGHNLAAQIWTLPNGMSARGRL
ncbi:MAG TPA: ricin-type beta-trefoil lectin domain protein [Steroidobacteraceae bacterium]|nr:ricin-type beta-trefoil lectin domain protein [Steroidobacteraceae bacterium]